MEPILMRSPTSDMYRGGQRENSSDNPYRINRG